MNITTSTHGQANARGHLLMFKLSTYVGFHSFSRILYKLNV